MACRLKRKVELRWGPDFLPGVGGEFLQCMSSDRLHDLYDFCHQNEWDWSSGCSGTDSPTWVMNAITDSLQRQGCHLGSRHCASAEIHEGKRNFIKQTSRPEVLFGDIWDLVAEKPYCHIRGRRKRFKRNQKWKCFIAGFSCKNASGLNHDTNTGEEICLMTGSTGMTFGAVCHVLHSQLPRTFVLESVVGILRQVHHLEKSFNDLGYHVVFIKSNPRLIIPHSRDRIYMIGHRDVCNAGAAFHRVIMESISQMEDLINEPLDVDQYLLSENHPVVTARRAHFQERLSVNKCRSAMQPRSAEKLSQGVTYASLWSDDLATVYPEAAVLPERELGLLANIGMGFPHPQALVANISQSNTSTLLGRVPTITPGGKYWLGHRCRTLTGAEALALQGLWIPPGTLSGVSDALLHDLAGNAFNAVSCMTAMLAAMVGAGRMYALEMQHKASLRTAPPAPLSLVEQLEAQYAADQVADEAEDTDSDESILVLPS